MAGSCPQLDLITNGGIRITLLGFTSKKLEIQKHPLMDFTKFGLEVGPKLEYWLESQILLGGCILLNMYKYT